MANTNTDFLRFSAYSIKELITRKLSEDSKFTDQVYEGSNLAILIDLFSYMAQCMLYSLNNAASESMFSDTQLYENMSRLVNFLGYNPKGIVPSSATFALIPPDSLASNEELYIPEFAYVDTGLTDNNGNKILFSPSKAHTITAGSNLEITMINGVWKKYDTVLIAQGNEYETFILTDVASDIANGYLVANNMVKVYVEKTVDDVSTYEKWDKTDFEIFTHNSSNPLSFAKIYTNQSKIYSVHLNENKQYEIKFGNGILGKKLDNGDKIHVYYFDTNGADGKIDISDLDSTQMKLQLDPSLFADQFIQMNSSTFPADVDAWQENVKNTTAQAITNFTEAKAEETADEIRENAPEWFKLGQRLVTADDYKYYMMNICDSDGIIDCKVQNNYEYMTTFYKWLYNLGGMKHSNPLYYLNETKLAKYDYAYADPSDSNNVYIWTKLQYSKLENLYDLYAQNIERIKSATAEVVFLEPIPVKFAIAAAPESVLLENIKSNGDIQTGTYVEITLENSSIYTPTAIKQKFEDVIIDFFKPTNNYLGEQINYKDLMNKLYNIPGIQNIRTVYNPDYDTANSSNMDISQSIVKDGLMFATWSDSMVDSGDDLDVGNSVKTLMPFQFPELYSEDIASRIVIIKKTVNSSNSAII